MTIDLMIQRGLKNDSMHCYSYSTHKLFLVLLFLTTLSGIMLHLFRIVNLPIPSYNMYVLHLMIAVPMLVVEVPFGKWSHMLYRPFATYLSAIKVKAKMLQA